MKPISSVCDDFRHALRKMASSVVVVTSKHGSTLNGMTATAVVSVSMDPPSLLVVVNRHNRSHATIRDGQAFAVNLLLREQEHLARHFASRADDAFADVCFCEGGTGVPLLADAVAVIECRVEKEIDHGTHTLFIGAVVSVSNAAGMPLLYHNGQYVNLEQAS